MRRGASSSAYTVTSGASPRPLAKALTCASRWGQRHCRDVRRCHSGLQDLPATARRSLARVSERPHAETQPLSVHAGRLAPELGHPIQMIDLGFGPQ